MSLKNIKTAADLLKEKADKTKADEKQAAIASKTDPETLAGLVDRVEALEQAIASLKVKP